MDKASVTQCHGQTRVGVQVGPGTDDVRETRSDSNPACEAWSNQTQELGHDDNSGVSIYSRTNFSLLLSSVFLSLNIACISLHMDWDQDIQYSFQNYINLVTWKSTTPSTLCGFPVRTQGYFPKGNIFVARAVWWGNLAMVLGQQPRYQRVSSSITMWQLFHKGPRFRRGTISYWPGDYYQLTRNEGSGVIDHGIRGVLQGKIQTTRVPFATRDNEFKSTDGFDLKKRFKCSARTSTISRYSVLYYPTMIVPLASEW